MMKLTVDFAVDELAVFVAGAAQGQIIFTLEILIISAMAGFVMGPNFYGILSTNGVEQIFWRKRDKTPHVTIEGRSKSIIVVKADFLHIQQWLCGEVRHFR